MSHGSPGHFSGGELRFWEGYVSREMSGRGRPIFSHVSVFCRKYNIMPFTEAEKIEMS